MDLFFRYVLNINYHDTWDETGPTDIIKHYKNASRLIAIASERLRLSASDFQHFILHHFSLWQSTLVTAVCSH